MEFKYIIDVNTHMFKREHALTQLNLLRHADVPAVRATSETVLWLDQQLGHNEIEHGKFVSMVEQHYNLIKTIDSPVGQVCSHALRDLLDVENKPYEDL